MTDDLDAAARSVYEACVTDFDNIGKDKIIAAIAAALRAQRRQAFEEAETAVRAACTMCNGSGYIEVRCDEQGRVIDGTECEYCGRPIVAIRQQAREEG